MIRSIIGRILRKLRRTDRHLDIKVKCPSKWYGNTYGGFYANPDIINENSIVYSVGIGEDISFDSALIEAHNCHVFGFDPTPKSIKWVESQQMPANFSFYQYGLSNETGVVDFFLPKNTDYVSGSTHLQDGVDAERKITVEMKTIKDIVAMLGHTQIDVLKMDIEGSEFDVIDDIISLDIPIKPVLIEFHGRFFDDGTNKVKDSVRKLKKAGYCIFAVSASKEEVSFVNEKLYKLK